MTESVHSSISRLLSLALGKRVSRIRRPSYVVSTRLSSARWRSRAVAWLCMGGFSWAAGGGSGVYAVLLCSMVDSVS